MFRPFLFILISVFATVTLSIDPPPGLRPAKAIENTRGGIEERRVLPVVEKSKDELIPPSNVRTPPNLSLRSRMIAAQNSAALSHDEPHEEHESTTSQHQRQQPVVFSKSPKQKKPSKTTPAIKKTVLVPAENEVKLPRITGPTPPKGNYGVNTVLQTNLVDSQGRIIKGLSSVPIPLPTIELRNKGQATASQIGNDEDRVVPVKFGGAGDS